MIIHSLRFPPFDPLSFYSIVKEIIELENKGVPTEQIELGLTEVQYDAIEPILDFIFPEKPKGKDKLHKLGEISIRIVEDLEAIAVNLY